MKNLILFLATSALTLLLSSCSDGIVSHSYKAKGVDLKKYKSYAWVKPGDAEYQLKYDQKVFIRLIHKLSEDELKKKGFVSNNESPDAVFIVDTKLEDRVSYSTTPQVSVGVGFGGPGYYGGFSAPVAGGDLVQHTYQQGMVYIEMYDTKTQKLLWRGWAEEQISYKNDIEADIRTAVKHIFARLPVKHK